VAIGRLATGFLTGIWLALSGIYDMEALGFGMSLEISASCCSSHCSWIILNWNLETLNPEKSICSGAYLASRIFIYTSTLRSSGFIMSLCLSSLQSQPTLELSEIYSFTLPCLGFTCSNNLFVLGIPAYEVSTQGVAPYGQLAQI